MGPVQGAKEGANDDERAKMESFPESCEKEGLGSFFHPQYTLTILLYDKWVRYKSRIPLNHILTVRSCHNLFVSDGDPCFLEILTF